MLRIYLETTKVSNIEKLIIDNNDQKSTPSLDSQLVDIVHSIREDMRNDLKDIHSIKW